MTKILSGITIGLLAGNSSKMVTSILGGIMKRDEKNQTRKIIVRVHIGGKKKPVTKEAIVCSKSGKIVKFL